MNQPEQHLFYAYADGGGKGHGHVIRAAGYEAAAVGYTELYSPPVDMEGHVRVVVSSLEHGRDHCFVIDLAEGAVEPCG